MIDFKKISYLSFLVCVVFAGSYPAVFGQERQRVVKTISSQPINQPQPPTDNPKSSSSFPTQNNRTVRPMLTTDIVVAAPEKTQPLVKKTGSSNAFNAAGSMAVGRMVYSSPVTSAILRGIQSRLGIPYLYGSTGPNRYDCSGFVWSVFRDAGVEFTRASARSLWAAGQPVTGDERFKFGTLVFLNGLGHMGIVADENGFYHASSSKGITYSPFKGYWESRVVGFRKLLTDTPKIVE
ncbi:MAG: C40 family peptidase [Pyrinomonadaceae bacterium]